MDDDLSLDDDILRSADDILSAIEGSRAAAGPAAGAGVGSGAGGAAAAAAASGGPSESGKRRDGAREDPSRREAQVSIVVSNPTRVGEGLNSHTTYEVHTQAREGSPDRPPHTVAVRRFSEFEWLHDALGREFPGAVVPPLPDKSVVRGAVSGRFANDFVEERRRGLEKFLNRIAAHAMLGRSAAFVAFLDEAPLNPVKEELAQRPGAGGKGFFQWFGETVQSISQTLSNVEMPKTAEDVVFDEASAYVATLDPQLQAVHKHVAAMVKKERDLATSYQEFGLALSRLGQAEEGTYGAALVHVGSTADRAAQLTAEQAQREQMVFEEPLRDYLRTVGAVRGALGKRSERHLTWQTRSAELAARQQRVAQAQQAGRGDRLRAAEQEVLQEEAAVAAAKAGLDEVHARVMQELEVFKGEKLVDFRNMMLDYVQLQIEHAQKMEEAWRDVIPHIEAIEVPAAPAAAAAPAGEFTLE